MTDQDRTIEDIDALRRAACRRTQGRHMSDPKNELIADTARPCEGCDSPLKAELCGRFDLIKPHWLCRRCQRLIGAVRLGTFASNAQIDGTSATFEGGTASE